MNRTVLVVFALGAGLLGAIDAMEFAHAEPTIAAPTQDVLPVAWCPVCNTIHPSIPFAAEKHGGRQDSKSTQKSVRADRLASSKGSTVGVAVITDLVDAPSVKPRILPAPRGATQLQAIAKPRVATDSGAATGKKSAREPAEEIVVKLEIPAKPTPQQAKQVAEPGLLAPLSGEPPKVLLKLSTEN